MIENALDYEGLKYYDEKSKSYTDDKITQFQNNVNKTFRKATTYADGTTTSINDLVQDGIYRIYIQKDSTDHNYLGFYGQALVETFIQGNIIQQRITNLSSNKTYLRYSPNQSTTPLSYDSVLTLISSNLIEIQTSLDNKINKKFALVGQTGSTTTNPWYKFASIDISTSRQDHDITFIVRRTYGNNYLDDMGILRAHIRANASTECEIAVLEWLTVSSSINTSNFVLAYINDTTTPSVKAELWVKCDVAYSMWNFDVLSEGDRLSNADFWTLYATMTVGSETTITNGYTLVESTTLDLGQNTDSATRVYATVNSNVSLSSYLIPYFDGNNTGNKELKMNDGFLYKANIGTASAVGRSALILGNSTPERTEGNSTGSMIIYGSDKYYTQLSSQKQTSDRSIVFPDASGTAALISNVPWTRSSGTAADHRIVGVHGFVSDLGKQVMLYIPMIFDRSVSYNSTLTISKLLCDIRTVEGALLGGGYDANLTQYVTETYIYVHQGLIRITLVKEDGWGVTNNTPLCGDCTIDYSIL